MKLQDLIQMLKEYDIKNIVSIDDGWKIAEGISEIISAQGIDKDICIKDYCEKYAIDIDYDEVSCFKIIEGEALKEIELFKEQIPKAYAAICENLNVDIDISLKALDSILCKINEQANYPISRLAEFEGNLQELQGNTLYILDKDMGKGSENEFIEYILSITDKRKDYNDLIIIYSNEVADLLTHERKLKYLQDNNKSESGQVLTILYQFWPITKSTDEDLLVNRMKEMISRSMYGKALSRMIEVKQISLKKTFDDLVLINIDNLDDMIIESFIEGGKITDSYELLIDSLVKRNTFEQAAASDVLAYEKGLLQYEVKRAKEILSENSIETKNQYSKFRNKSLKNKILETVTKNSLLHGIADYSINLKYDNPSMGDLYVFTDAGSNREYAGMLISQECSIVIRKKYFADEPQRNAKELLLLIFDITEISEENIDDKMLQELDNHIWPIKIDDKICLLKNTKKSIYVSPELLDLCGLNSTGKAKIQFEENSLEFKSAYSQEYYANFKQKLQSKIQNTINHALKENEIKRHDCNIDNMIISLSFGVLFKGDFEMRRICKIDEKHALHIIHEYLNGISKVGLPVVPSL